MHRVSSASLGRTVIALLVVSSFAAASIGGGVSPVAAIDFPGGPSTQFAVNGAVETALSVDQTMLQGMPTQTVMAETRTRMGSQGTAMYRGVLLTDVLAAAKVQLDPAVKNDQLARAITAYGSDGYHVTFAYGEIDPDFGAQPILVAFEKDGQPLADSDGAFELIVPGDNLAGRWVKNLVALTVTAPGM